MKVSFSPAAQADLLDIAVFIAQDNPVRALTFVDELESKCDALGGAPGIGTLRPELGDGICVLPHGRYLIFYRAVNQDLRIERIMHGARDIGGDDFEVGEALPGHARAVVDLDRVAPEAGQDVALALVQRPLPVSTALRVAQVGKGAGARQAPPCAGRPAAWRHAGPAAPGSQHAGLTNAPKPRADPP